MGFNRRLRPRWSRIAAVAAIIAALLLMLRFWTADAPTELAFPASVGAPLIAPVGEPIAGGGGQLLLGEDERLRFSANLDLQRFEVTVKENGFVWSSSPDLREEEQENELGALIAQSPLMISYTSNYREQITAALLATDAVWTAYRIPNGVQIRYELAKLQMSFIVELDLHEGGLRVRIPDAGIAENGSAGLASIAILPMFGAARQGDAGYMVIPDGSGAIVSFDSNHLKYENNGYYKPVYGYDLAVSSGPALAEERIAVPAFGMVKPGNGYVQTVVSGAEDAAVAASPPGVLRLGYYRGGFAFQVRKAYIAKLDGAGYSIGKIEENRIRSDREIRFDFVSGTDMSYARLAPLVYERLFGRVEGQRTEQLDNSPLIRVMMSASRAEGSLLGQKENMASFAEVAALSRRILDAGIRSFRLSLAGWQEGGYLGSNPSSFEPSRDLGGREGLLALAAWAGQEGIGLSLADNLLDLYRTGGVKLSREAARQPNRQLIVRVPRRATGQLAEEAQWHRMSVAVADNEAVDARLRKLKEWQSLNIDAERIGDDLFSDYNPSYPQRRSDTARYYTSWLERMREAGGTVGIEYGYAYAVPAADRIMGIPTASSAHFMLDQSIPFLQMIYHGSIDYYATPANRGHDPRRDLLRALEYGAIPSFELTYRDPDRLAHTYYDRLFSSRYDQWLTELGEAYAMWEGVLREVRDARLVDHRELGNEVYATAYSNGVQVFVNYGSRVYRAAGLTVEPMAYAVKRGEGP